MQTLEYLCVYVPRSELFHFFPMIHTIHSIVKSSEAKNNKFKLRCEIDVPATDQMDTYLSLRTAELLEAIRGLVETFESKEFDWMFILSGMRVSDKCLLEMQKGLQNYNVALRHDSSGDD